MKKILNISSVAVMMMALSCTSQRKSEIHLNDGKVVLTRIDVDKNGLKTILYLGSYSKKLPSNYVYVNHRKLLDGFEALLDYTDDKVILLQPYQYFKYVGDSSSIIIKTINDSTFYTLFFNKKDMRYTKVQN